MPSPSTTPALVLSRYQAGPLLAAYAADKVTAQTSPDLGLSLVEVHLTGDGVTFPNGKMVPWDDLRRINASENQCFAVEGGAIRSIQVFSETTNWLRSLMPTPGAPTMLVAGFPMHRIKDTDPWKDSEAKIAAAAPVVGDVLDTTTGLGYTAILAARTSAAVVTVEIDPAGLEITRQNPWSRDLFENPKIRQIVGDIYEEIKEMPTGAFRRVLHDPPTFSLAGELYSRDFYRQVHRVLRPGGTMFHYLGDPTSTLGKRTTTNAIQRLREVGFRRIERAPAAFGVLAYR